MNKQTSTGIEWTDYTSNPIQGCRFGCSWVMPNGKIAECYAKTIAERMRSDKFFPRGFEEITFRPQEFIEWARLNRRVEKTNAASPRVFVGSMADIGHPAVKDEWLEEVIAEVSKAPRVTFQMLTKNPRRFSEKKLPSNLWLGISSPPTAMSGITIDQRSMFLAALHSLRKTEARIKFVSIEPLSFDVVPMLEQYIESLDWLIVGAASDGHTKYQPDAEHFRELLDLVEKYPTPLFFKGNLRNNPLAVPWREEFPISVP